MIDSGLHRLIPLRSRLHVLCYNISDALKCPLRGRSVGGVERRGLLTSFKPAV